jgi:predicted N-acetyltransferase YhbS
MVIRPETSADADAIAAVNRAASDAPGEAELVAAIRDPDRFAPELSPVA